MEENTLNSSIGVPNNLIQEIKNVYRTMHPTQFVFDVVRKFKMEAPLYTYASDDTYAYKCICKFDDSIEVRGYNNQKKEAKSKLIYNKQNRNRI